MIIESDMKLDYKDVLIRPKRSVLNSRSLVDLSRQYKFRNSGRIWSGLPIMAANMDGVGTFGMAKALSKFGMTTCITKQNTIQNWNKAEIEDIHKDYISISIGTNLEAYKAASEIIKEKNLKLICIDIANGYSEHFVDFVKTVRKDFPDKVIIAGNVVTADMTQELILSGADIVKVGIGPGSVCTTRIQTGVGYPQLSAVIECADAAHGLGGHIIADGGCTCPGDVAKAFAAGADFVMLGGMLAGHDEGGGEIKVKRYKTSERRLDLFNEEDLGAKYEDKKFVEFYGMSSDTAMEKHNGGVAEYRTSEGRTVHIPYKGPVGNTILDICGGLRSTCTYVGARTLKQLSKCTTFVKCTQQFNSVFI